MLELLLVPFLIIFGIALSWGFSPYFTWKKLSKQPVDESLMIVTKQGKEPLGDYLRGKQKEGNRVQHSIIVPAYNEQKRLHNMLPKTIEFFEKSKYTYEIIVVNDASKDKTTDVALEYANVNGKNIDLKVLEYKVNQGKGGAVRSGCIASSGDFILMVDADGASEISEFEKLLRKLKEIEKEGLGLAVGSRRVVDEQSEQDRKWYRQILSFFSNFIVQNICGVKLNDTQCGFKLFTRRTAHNMFRPLHIRRWAFDVELFVIANEMHVPYAEIPINYCDQEDSKLNVVTDSLQMARDFILIKLFYVLKLWKRTHTDKLWESLIPSSPQVSPSRSKSPRAKRE